jgi:hypothetical protein
MLSSDTVEAIIAAKQGLNAPKNNETDSDPITVGDGGASWRKKAEMRAKQRASAEGRRDSTGKAPSDDRKSYSNRELSSDRDRDRASSSSSQPRWKKSADGGSRYTW